MEWMWKCGENYKFTNIDNYKIIFLLTISQEFHIPQKYKSQYISMILQRDIYYSFHKSPIYYYYIFFIYYIIVL